MAGRRKERNEIENETKDDKGKRERRMVGVCVCQSQLHLEKVFPNCILLYYYLIIYKLNKTIFNDLIFKKVKEHN